MLRFLKDFTLPIAMTLGVLMFFVIDALPADTAQVQIYDAIAILQPVFIFTMLFLSFCKIDPTNLKLKGWHGWHLLFQIALFVIVAGICLLTDGLANTLWQSLALCLIVPTAAAGVVVTNKLGGDTQGLTTYTLLVNFIVALVIPAIAPLIVPHEGRDFLTSFWIIMGKITPMLICPFLVAMTIRYVFPKVHQKLVSVRDLTFYIWAVSLMMAITVSCRSMVLTHATLTAVIGIAVMSLIACILNFAFGHYVGQRYGTPISASQAIGQKNTAFAIWLGFTFLNPVTSVAGGFYSLWQNCWNTWQIKRKNAGGAPKP